MALLIKKAYQGYYWLMDDVKDPRSDDYFLVPSVFPVFFLGLGYLYFVNKWGPEFMKNREPFQIERIVTLYNIIQVTVNSYLVITATYVTFTTLNIYCNEVDYSDDPVALKFLNLAYIYFMVKLLDLFDTIFFVLRKKTNQATFLHVYHHYGMIYLGWVGVKFLGGGHSVILGYINSVVHAVMYSYYLLTSYDPKYKQSVWWKKHITQLQLLQFFILLFAYGSILFQPECKYPKFAALFFVPQNIFMFFLFGDFYWRAYLKPKPKGLLNGEEKKES